MKRKIVLFGFILTLAVSLLLSVYQPGAGSAATTAYKYQDNTYKVIVGPEGNYSTVAGGTSGQYQLFVTGCNSAIIQTDSHRNGGATAVLNGGCDSVSNKKITIQVPSASDNTPKFTGTWITHSVIKSGDLQFIDRLTDNTLSYQAYTGNSCENNSAINGWPKGSNYKANADSNATAVAKITLFALIKDKCTNQGTANIKLSDPNNAFQDYFVWDSADTIKTSDGQAVFVSNSTSNTVFKGYSGDKNNLTCPSNVKADIGSPYGTFTMHNNKIADGYPDEVYNFGKYLTRVGDKCPTSADSPTIAIGLTERSKKPPTKGGTGDDAGTNGGSCDSQGGLGWIICPVIELLGNATTGLDNIIQSQLETPNPENVNGGNGVSSNSLKEAWGRLRNIALIILVPIMLIMVIGTAIGVSALDAYTVKRAMPRLLIAVIFISLSWYITIFLVNLTNVVGAGVYGLLTNPFGLANQNLADMVSAGSGGVLSWSVLVGTVVALNVGLLSIPIILSLLLTSALALFIGFAVLVMRNVFIYALILVAPLAILSWIFPSNDKMWKLWWGTFSKLLLMYPMIMALIASGKIFASIVPQQQGSSAGLFTNFAIIVAYITPYFFIPATFKFAGGVFANLSGFVNDRGRGAFDRLKKGRQESRARNIEELRAGNRFKSGTADNFAGRMNRRLQKASFAGKAGFRPSRWSENVTSAVDANNLEAALEKSEKIPGAKAFFASDDLMRAGLEGGGDYQKTANYLRSKGWSDDEARLGAAQVNQMRRSMGSEQFSLAALAKTPATGTAYVGDDISEWHEDIAAHTHGNRSIQASIVAAGKAGFRSAQRYEVSEAAFGTHMEAIKMAETGVDKDGKQIDKQGITNHVVDAAYASGGAAAVIGARNEKVAEMFVLAARRDLVKSFASGDRKQQLRALAQVADIQDQLGGAKRTVSDVIAGGKIDDKGRLIPGLMDFDIGGQTALQRLNEFRGDEEFQQARRELGRERDSRLTPEQQAALAQGLVPPGTEPQPPVGGTL